MQTFRLARGPLVALIGGAVLAIGLGTLRAKGLITWDRGQAPPIPHVAASLEKPKDPALLTVTSISCYGQDRMCLLTKELDVVLGSSARHWVTETKRSVRELSLVIEGIGFPHVTAEATGNDLTTLRFRLDPNRDPEQWKRLFAGRDETARFAVALAVPSGATVVGRPPEMTFASTAAYATFEIRPDVSTGVIYGFLAVVVAALIVLGRSSNLLRDAGSANDDERPYSLARTQLAVWTVVVIGSYLFIWTILGSQNPINQTALILLGLSSATGLTAAVLDKSTPRTSATRKSAGFLIDILSDGDGVTIYRLQMVIWTLVLAFAFAWSVWTNLAMPDFDTILLGLLGVSNGTYVVPKLTAQSGSPP